MEKVSRRKFIKKSVIGSAGLMFTANSLAYFPQKHILGANDTINVAVVGFRSHGMNHVNAYKKSKCSNHCFM